MKQVNVFYLVPKMFRNSKMFYITYTIYTYKNFLQRLLKYFRESHCRESSGDRPHTRPTIFNRCRSNEKKVDWRATSKSRVESFSTGKEPRPGFIFLTERGGTRSAFASLCPRAHFSDYLVGNKSALSHGTGHSR